MKKSLAGAGAIPALLAILLAGAAPAAAACDPATHALQYLAAQQRADGSIDGAVGETLDFALGAVAAGYDPRTLKSSSGKSPYDWLQANIGAATADPNRAGKLVQGVVAGGFDPHSFASKNLLQALQAYFQSSNGAYIANPSDPNDPCQVAANGVYCQANAILGLVSAHDPAFPVPAKAVTYLKGLQQSNGAWQLFGSDDTNATAMALMALAAVSDASANSKAFTFLHTQQDASSGGFVESTSFQTKSDPDSDSLVIDGLVAAGQDPASTAWSNGHGNAVSDVLTFQDSSTGGFFFDHAKPTPSAFTTSEVPAGLARKPFPVKAAYKAGTALPPAGCTAAAAVSASPSPAVGLPHSGAAPAPPPVAPAVTLVALAALAGAALGGLALRR